MSVEPGTDWMKRGLQDKTVPDSRNVGKGEARLHKTFVTQRCETVCGGGLSLDPRFQT